MHEIPETRDSLLVRLKDTASGEAWAEFVAIYRPLVYRLARRRGFQDADAQDLVQRVMMSVSSSIQRWDEQGGDGRFRAWLSRVARNAIIDAVRRARPDGARGGTSVLEQLGRQPSPDETIEDAIEHEYRREVFRWAARQVQQKVEESSWQAFWLTAVLGQSASDVAAKLEKSIGSIYTARSRVMRRLQDKVREYDDNSE